MYDVKVPTVRLTIALLTAGEPADQPSPESPEDGETIRLVEQAVERGVLSEREVALILATRHSREPVAELALASGERRETVSMRRKRAEEKLANWLAEEHEPIT